MTQKTFPNKTKGFPLGKPLSVRSFCVVLRNLKNGTELSPLIQKSEKISESQGEILENFGKNETQDSSDVREYKNPDYREDVPTEETSSPSESAVPSTPETIDADYETFKAKAERKRLLYPTLFG